MKWSSCPVGNTCPRIDSIIKIINASVERLQKINQCELRGLEDEADDIASDLDQLVSEIEELRSANEELRSWGSKKEDELDTALREIEALEKEAA